jgi:hypothetical protein
MKQSGGVKKFITAKAKQAKQFITGDAGVFWLMSGCAW